MTIAGTDDFHLVILILAQNQWDFDAKYQTDAIPDCHVCWIDVEIRPELYAGDTSNKPTVEYIINWTLVWIFC